MSHSDLRNEIPILVQWLRRCCTGEMLPLGDYDDDCNEDSRRGEFVSRTSYWTGQGTDAKFDSCLNHESFQDSKLVDVITNESLLFGIEMETTHRDIITAPFSSTSRSEDKSKNTSQ